MADVHKGHDSTGIKLFGKMINVQTMRELKEEPVNKSEVLNDHENDNDNDNENNNNDDEDQSSLVNKRPDKIIPCPRCKSMETKFCYFNNYNVNQPRHFCKGCQRYWTAGGALRNVPVGAGRRKAKPPCGLLYGGLEDTFSDVSFLGDTIATSNSGIHFNNGMVDWDMATHRGFEHLFPAKRRRNFPGDS